MAEVSIHLEWLQFAKSDLDCAAHLYRTMYPMPLEIICYHCQQAAEKALEQATDIYGWADTQLHNGIPC